jgi:hypothetical protein
MIRGVSEIITPDQRLRVFVSSTLQELAPERAAALRAITALHLAPVLFELGARPHPPRSLYRAYLEQSDGAADALIRSVSLAIFGHARLLGAAKDAAGADARAGERESGSTTTRGARGRPPSVFGPATDQAAAAGS